MKDTEFLLVLKFIFFLFEIIKSSLASDGLKALFLQDDFLPTF